MTDEDKLKRTWFLLNDALMCLPPSEEENHPFPENYRLDPKLARKKVSEAIDLVMSLR